MTTVDTSRTVADLGHLEGEILAVARQVLGQAAAFVAEEARQTTTFKDQTGALRRSIHREPTGELEQRVVAGGSEAPEAIFVEDGTRSHDIRPRRVATVSSRRSASKSFASVLRFQIDGHWFSKSVVHHPGTTATHFMADAAHAGEDAIPRFMEMGLNQVIGG